MSNKLLMRMLVDYLRLMNKYCIDAVIIVEGKSDVSYLSSFIDSNFFITNGYDISEEKLDFLSRVAKVNKVIIFTDNDKAGNEIQCKIQTKINGVIAVKSAKLIRNNYKKAGIAETEKEEILKVLKPYLTDSVSHNNYDLSRVISLSKNPEEVRKHIINDYRLIEGNNKYLNDQLNMLKVDVNEFKQKYGN